MMAHQQRVAEVAQARRRHVVISSNNDNSAGRRHDTSHVSGDSVRRDIAADVTSRRRRQLVQSTFPSSVSDYGGRGGRSGEGRGELRHWL